jgi:hypothetical protein
MLVQETKDNLVPCTFTQCYHNRQFGNVLRGLLIIILKTF